MKSEDFELLKILIGGVGFSQFQLSTCYFNRFMKSDEVNFCARPARSILFFVHCRAAKKLKKKKIPRVGGENVATKWECCRPNFNLEL